MTWFDLCFTKLTAMQKKGCRVDVKNDKRKKSEEAILVMWARDDGGQDWCSYNGHRDKQMDLGRILEVEMTELADGLNVRGLRKGEVWDKSRGLDLMGRTNQMEQDLGRNWFGQRS